MNNQDNLDNLNKEYVKKFHQHFACLSNKKIVLYGLGYRTGAIIESLGEVYNFIGLMDRDKDNIGKNYFGCRVLDDNEVISKADCIIIVSVSFYDVIYKRISYLDTEFGIPIYFPNGKKAELCKDECSYFSEEYSKLNLNKLKKQIDLYEIVTFDLFDTLLMRKVYSPDAVFDLVEAKLQQSGDKRKSFSHLRKKAMVNLQKKMIPTLNQIYDEMQKLTQWDKKELEYIKKLEIETEASCLIPRWDVVELYQYALKQRKKVYIVSDMYLPSNVLNGYMKKLNISTEYEKMIVSCEYNCNKEGGLWGILRNIVGGGMIIHFGDDELADIEAPLHYHIDTCHIYSARQMMKYTALSRMSSMKLSLWNQISLGLILAEFFNSPFVGNNKSVQKTGSLNINKEEELGYIGYAALICEFIFWICKYCKNHEIKKLLFCARDGLLLKEDFELFCDIMGNDIQSKYLKISRQLIRRASIYTEDDLNECMRLAYRGKGEDFFRNRFGIEVSYEDNIEMPEDIERIKAIVYEKKEEIFELSRLLRENYLKYLNEEVEEVIENQTALVDFGYTGSTQYYLSRVLEKGLCGLYMLADLNEQNVYNIGQEKASYVYSQKDPSGIDSRMFKLFLPIESVFTAPYGTYIGCNEDGSFDTAPLCMNQYYFSEKQRINHGIKKYINDMTKIINPNIIKQLSFTDGIGQELLELVLKEGGGVQVSKKILDTFHSDDFFKITTDRKIFE